MIEVIGRAARDPAVDIEKMERLLAMQERMMALQAKAEYGRAMSACQAEMPHVFKDANNTFTKSRYSKPETISKVIKPIYTKHGFSLSYSTAECPIPEWIRVTCTVRHTAGHEEVHHVDLPMDVEGAKGGATKSRVQGCVSTISYGRRNLALMIFNVATTDDRDGNPAEKDDRAARREMEAKLWNLLAPHRGTENNWTAAQQWLWDECVMPPDQRVTRLSGEEMAKLIAAVERKLNVH